MGEQTATAAKITSLTPSSGPMANFKTEQSIGDCTIKGSGFGRRGTSFVTFGGYRVEPKSWSDTEIVVPIPWQVKPIENVDQIIEEVDVVVALPGGIVTAKYRVMRES